jgi:hypothetical protein
MREIISKWWVKFPSTNFDIVLIVTILSIIGIYLQLII